MLIAVEDRMQPALWSGFMRSAEAFPERPAIVVDRKSISYKELREAACRIAATLQSYPEYSPTPLTAVFAYRTVTAFTSVLGSLLGGNGYVPLNRTFPVKRTQLMFERSECCSIVVDAQSMPQLGNLLQVSQRSILVLLPDVDDVELLRVQWPRHRFVGSRDLKLATCWREPVLGSDAIAYLLFTSGSTGVPKGVMVAQRNVTSFLDYMVDRYRVNENDRFSQMFDMTFDLSVFDMFVCWERGACLCCPSQKSLISPGRYVQEMALTIWFSVPSTAVFMKQLGMLKSGQYPSLRFSLFCGEPLPVASASAWLEAAPNSIVENLYGPTELTIACTVYRWDPLRSPSESELGIVPIGYPFPEMEVMVADENLREVGHGEQGELLMNGPQMSLGYWKDPEKTKAAFTLPPGKSDIYYRTGDRVRRRSCNGPLTHLGRIDFQVKVLGHRVELGEVEDALRKACGFDGVIAVGWPPLASGFGGIEVFIEGPAMNVDQIRKTVAAGLPEYMVPKRIHFFANLPRNPNGKYDRKALSTMLESGL
jgi:amino acid adenylation domain-containing protein